MQNFLWRSFLITCLVWASCGKATPELKDIDFQAWKEDKNGCMGKRSTMTDAIRQQRDKLLGLNEMEIVSLLGKPDENELYTRNQKFYRYFLDAAPVCSSHENTPLRLVIRFNAMGLAKEIMIE